ncbi:MAG: HlyD family efflux transporter periplasmic adaptor subunit [Candidatus Eremiobacteraeota bacterium]|nr:HlyD family efflux transporter periplasmic adaptor subunit [Candidatus Eremiobacteraeota bacterium]
MFIFRGNKESARVWLRKTAGGVAAAIALCSCASHANYGYSGTLQAPSAAVGSTVGGRVVRVAVNEGSSVRKGAVLVQFDDAQQRAAYDASTARLAQAHASLAELLAGARSQDVERARDLAEQQRAQAQAAQHTVPYQSTVAVNQLQQALAQESDAQVAARIARTNADRMRNLYSTGDVSAQERDSAVQQAAHADAQVANAAAGVRAAQSQSANATGVTLPQNAAAAQAGYRAAEAEYRSLAAGARPEEIHQAQANVRAAQGDLTASQARLAETVVRAPADGVVTSMDLHPGDLVAPGASVATIEQTGNPYVRIFIPQSDLGHVKLGGHVSVRSDANTGTFTGVIEQIDSRAQFTPQNVQTANDRAVLSFGVKVRVHDDARQLHPGTTVEVALP